MLQSAFVPGSRLNSTGTPPRRTCFSHILAYPWELGGITATTQLPAHRRGPLHILKPEVPSAQQLVDELLLEIELRAAESVVESTYPIACERIQSRCRPSPSTHSERIWRGKGGLQTHILIDGLEFTKTRTHTHTHIRTMRVSSGFHTHGHGQGHAGHYGVAAQGHSQSQYGAVVCGSFARPLPIPVLPPAGFNHQHTGQLHHHQQLQHGRSRNQSQHLNLTMADPYMASDDEIAHLQKLSSEYEPEATVGLLPSRLRPPLTVVAGTASGRAPEQRSHHDAVCQRRPGLSGEDGGAAHQVRLLSHLPW